MWFPSVSARSISYVTSQKICRGTPALPTTSEAMSPIISQLHPPWASCKKCVSMCWIIWALSARGDTYRWCIVDDGRGQCRSFVAGPCRWLDILYLIPHGYPYRYGFYAGFGWFDNTRPIWRLDCVQTTTLGLSGSLHW